MCSEIRFVCCGCIRHGHGHGASILCFIDICAHFSVRSAAAVRTASSAMLLSLKVLRVQALLITIKMQNNICVKCSLTCEPMTIRKAADGFCVSASNINDTE